MSRLTTISVLAVLAVALAGCGGGKAASTATNTKAPAAHKNAATSFGVANVSGVGNVVVDGKGRTVYILTSGAKKNVPCTDANGCTGVWPDLPLPNGTSAATATGGLNGSLLSTMKLSDGETYPTVNGYLVYEYTGDSARGQANGEGIKSFGGTWYVLDPSGMAIKQSGGGNGYP